jgi:AraC-like DNA-binding protein
MQGWVACWECMFNKVILSLDDNSMNELLGYANLMLEEFRRNRPKKDLILRNLLNVFIISAARLMDTPLAVMQMDATQNRLVHQFKQHVDVAFRKVTRVASYAEMLAVTPGHLNDVIKSTTGKTAKQIIDEKRILEAKRLLFWGDHNLKEIAALLNFENDSYFNRFFKKHTGQTPALFQRAIREKYN